MGNIEKLQYQWGQPGAYVALANSGVYNLTSNAKKLVDTLCMLVLSSDSSRAPSPAKLKSLRRRNKSPLVDR